MSTPKKILKFPYEKEYVLTVIEDCLAFIESYCIINDISSAKITLPYYLKVSYLFANNPPSSWLELVNDYLESHRNSSFSRDRSPAYLKDTLYTIKEEVMSNEKY